MMYPGKRRLRLHGSYVQRTDVPPCRLSQGAGMHMAPAAAAVAAAGAEAAAVEEDDSAPPPHKGRGWRRWAALSTDIILQKQNLRPVN